MPEKFKEQFEDDPKEQEEDLTGEIKPEEASEEEENNIIPIDFGRARGKKKKPPMGAPRVKDSASSFDTEHLFKYTAPEDVNPEEWNRAAEKARKEILPFVTSLRGKKSARSYHERFANFQEFSNEELLQVVLKFGEPEWIKNPAYYKALAKEMILRSQYPKKIKKIVKLKVVP